MSAKDVFYRVGVYVKGQRERSNNSYVYATREDAEASAQDLMMRWTMMVDYDIVEISPEEVRDRGLVIRHEPLIKGPNHRVSL